ncbi:MAG: exodeoxyribonuclease V subunit gamma [Kiritimatiellae bacterium]|nr:exodeoxyribonuclease V subunit gamma [Kiritimatiellia bacterium]
MSFYLYHGNDAQKLAGRLGELLFTGSRDPFAEETVVVPNSGLAKWLSLEIAKSRGLCPQIEFLRPGRFIYSHIFNPMRGVQAETDQSTFIPEVVVWEIFEWLKTCQEPRVTGFVAGDELKCWQLAKRLARLFDSYMTYRQEMLQAWEQGELVSNHEDEPWQRELWVSLTSERSDYFSALCEEFMKSPEKDFKPRQQSYYFFGVTALPLCHVQVLQKFAESTDVHFFMLNPCESLWDDVKSEKALLKEQLTVGAGLDQSLSAFYDYQCNPLLGGMGRVGRDFFAMMLERVWDYESEAHFYRFNDGDEETLLRQIRRDIQQNVRRREPWSGSHDSLSVHVCHSAMREVEVLKDQIIRAFREIEGLEPKDVRVLLPKPADYAPFIDVVFGEASDNPLPYHIADKSVAEEYLECRAFLKLLTTALGRFKASEILDLLSFGCIRSTFGLDEKDLMDAAVLLKRVNLAWGVDGAFKQELGASDQYLHTWAFALDRLILGASMSGVGFNAISIGENQCIPEETAEGNARLAGALAELIEQLIELRSLCDNNTLRSASEWMAALKCVISTFFCDESSAGICALQRSLAKLQWNVEQSRATQADFSFSVLMALLRESMESAAISDNAVSGRITFGQFKQLGTLPAKVICMLGMNDGEYPHVERRPGFDLTAIEHRLGDVSAKDEERYAFLEALLAASERLIICYTGRSQKDNAELPPAIVVSELLDSVALYCPGDKKMVVVEHPLHPFSPRYFEKGRATGLANFSRSNYRVAAQISGASQPQVTKDQLSDLLPDEKVGEVELHQLLAFFSSPAAWFYKERVGASVSIRDAATPSDEELFELDALERYNLNSTLFDGVVRGDGSGFNDRFEATYRSGALPVYDGELRRDTEQVLNAFKEELHTMGDPVHCQSEQRTIPLSNIALHVKFDSRCDNGRQILMRPSGEKGKDVLRATLYHLAWCACGETENLETIYLSYDKKGNRVQRANYAGIDAATARIKLDALIEWYWKGLRRPLCFDMNVCWSALSKNQELLPEEILKKWRVDGYAPGSGADEVARSIFGEELVDTALIEFQALAKDVLGAVMEVRK